ncbi:MAG TPA: ATP-binding cassette domain-containing protein, partial [Pseudomonas sp.]|nr:ATP-binding cassette domain-containing protein [Pseudomonas sp.]
LMAFVAYKTQFISRIASLIDHLFELQMLKLQGERLADIVIHPPEENHPKVDSAVLSQCEASIEITGLVYRYSEQEPNIINSLDLCIREGECISITGCSGSGKSTLVRLMLGILLPTSGQIRIAGFEFDRIGLDCFRGMVGTVMQDDVLFAGSIAENISFFESHTELSWIMQCAEAAAIHSEIEAMPMGYNTLVGDMGTVLSGGQKQRILLARDLYKKHRILFLDEATSHLDVLCEQKVNSAIKALHMTRIIVAHRQETIDSADRTITLEAGKIISDTSIQNYRL